MTTNQYSDHPEAASGPVFALRAGKTVFSLDLSNLLQCLRAAEREGCVPPAPAGWWENVAIHFPGRQEESHDADA